MSAPSAYGLRVPRSLAEVLEAPDQVALIVYDAQVGVLAQIPDAERVTGAIARTLEVARRGGLRVIFSRHVHLPPRLMGVSGLRTGMVWEGTDDPSAVRPLLARDSPGFALVPELHVADDEAVFDKTAMSVFEGTPVDTVLRDCGVNAFAICGVALEIGIEPSVRHGLDLGYIPIVVRDACGYRDEAAAQRAYEGFAFAGTPLVTDLAGFEAALLSSRTAAG
ncbi:MAG TPA: isochorismatase family cysteine hydrolase [Candidatus Acidoferrum sp.]|nr:isochorismatase family cysteine hydrolase [Candidatus Acidoferrum sp.]